MKINGINNKLNVVGINIKKYRELKGYTQRELCEKLELVGVLMYHTDIHNIEHQNKTIRDYEIKGICKVLNITLDQLFENTDKYFE